MRILQLTDLYPPVIGGTERHVQRLAIELAQRGHESLVATLRLAGEPEYEIGFSGERVFRLRSLYSRIPKAHTSHRPYHPPFPDPVVQRELRTLITTERPDVIYAHNWIVFSYAGLFDELRVPLVYVLHDYCMTCPAKTLLRGPDRDCSHTGRDRLACSIETYGITRGAAIDGGLALFNHRLRSIPCTYVAISTAVAEASRIGLGPDADLRVIPTFIADGLAERAAGRPRPSFLPPGDYMLFVGALGRHKGVPLLLDAYRQLQPPKPQLVLLAARGSVELPPLPDGVLLQTDVEHDDVMAAWRDCLFGIVPSMWPEPFGQVALEALTMGRPVIASAAGGLAEIVRPGQNGLLFSPGAQGELVAAMQRLINNPELRERLGAQADRGVQRYAVSAVADSVEKLLAELVG